MYPMNNYNELTNLFKVVGLASVAFLMLGVLCYLPAMFVHAALKTVVALVVSLRGASARPAE